MYGRLDFTLEKTANFLFVRPLSNKGIGSTSGNLLVDIRLNPSILEPAGPHRLKLETVFLFKSGLGDKWN